MTMNAFLAHLYGTAGDDASQPTTNELEKLAQAEVLDQFLKQDNVTLDNLSGDQILKVANHLFGPNNEIAKMAMEKMPGESDEEYKARMAKKEGGGEKKEATETMEEKVAEADFLGRVMAHSFWQENGKIKSGAHEPGHEGDGKGDDGKSAYDKMQEKMNGKKDEAGEKKEASSALDILAVEKARAMLKEAGIDPDTGASTTEAATPTVPAAASEQDKLAGAIEQRAVEILKGHGYTFNG